MVGLDPRGERERWKAVGSAGKRWSEGVKRREGGRRRRTRDVDQVLHPLLVVLGGVLDRNEDDAVLELFHKLRREDLELEVAPDRRKGKDDSRVAGLADRRGEVAKVLCCPIDRVAEFGSAAAPGVRPHLREDGEEDEFGRRAGEDGDRLGEGPEAGSEDVVECVLVRVRDPVGVVLSERRALARVRKRKELERTEATGCPFPYAPLFILLLGRRPQPQISAAAVICSLIGVMSATATVGRRTW